ncbi:MAG: hypothetical protein AAF491_00025 [Verrucomicrobiota bacterium]
MNMSADIRDDSTASSDFPDRAGWMVGLAAFALVTSLIPILSVPAAISALIMGIRRITIPAIKVPAIAAIAMAGISLPVALISAVAGVVNADASNNANSICQVHEQMDERMSVEIQSGEHMQRIVQQLASIDVSDCPDDYQEVYGELIEVLTVLAFHAARNEKLTTQVGLFIETLIESFGNDLSAMEDIRLRDEELELRLELVGNKLRLVCAKYGVVMEESVAQ